MKVVYTDRFNSKLAEVYEFGIARFGHIVADRTYLGTLHHIEEFLATYPRAGRWRSSIGCFHAWIPGTPFIAFYRLRDDTLEALALFHHAQDTADFQPDQNRTPMTIDAAKLPYRPCVGAMILNAQGLIWIGRRYDAPGDAQGRGTWWQMPQGGIDEGEEPSRAVLREVAEETGLTSLEIAAELPGSHLYDLPPHLVAKKIWGGKYRGQSQKWFVLRFTGDDREVAITPLTGPKPEFDAWRWAKANELLDLIVPFKRDVYRAVLTDASRLGIISI